MKKIILIFLSCVSVAASAQHKTKYTYNITLGWNDTIQTTLWIRQNPFEDYEKSLTAQYGQSIKSQISELLSDDDVKRIVDSEIDYYQDRLLSNSFYNTTATKEKQKIDNRLANPNVLRMELEKDIVEMVGQNINHQYKNDYQCFGWNLWKYNSLFHLKVKNLAFRNALYNKAVEVLCKLAAYYPKDYRTHLVSAFSESLKVLDDIASGKHSYTIQTDESKNWKPLVIFVDGVPDIELGYGITGFLLRRVYMDNIPLSEVRTKTISLIAKLKAVDNSKNDNIMSKYVINNEIAFCVGASRNFFVSLASNKEFVPFISEYEQNYYGNTIFTRYNNGQVFYQIENGYTWQTELKTIVLDKYFNVIYHEPLSLSQPIQIKTLQSQQNPSPQQNSKSTLTR